MEAEAARNQWFFGGAVNPRDKDVVVKDEGDTLTFTGRKSFSTGSKVSDVTVLEGVLEGTDDHVFAIVPSDSAGLTFHDDWDNIGQRLTESGGVTLDAVRVPWSAAAGYVDKSFRPRVYNTLNVPTIQLVFANFYLGIAAGALETAATYTRTRSRAWLHGGHDRAVDEPYVIDTYGDLTAKLWAVEALADTVAVEGQKLHDDPDAVTEQARGEFEVRVAAVKARATDVALEVTNRIYLWAGIGLVRGGAGTALVGSHDEVTERIKEYAALGIEEFVLSGYPHLEEAYWFGEGVLPRLQAQGLWQHPFGKQDAPSVQVPFAGAESR